MSKINISQQVSNYTQLNRDSQRGVSQEKSSNSMQDVWNEQRGKLKQQKLEIITQWVEKYPFLKEAYVYQTYKQNDWNQQIAEGVINQVVDNQLNRSEDDNDWNTVPIKIKPQVETKREPEPEIVPGIGKSQEKKPDSPKKSEDSQSTKVQPPQQLSEKGNQNDESSSVTNENASTALTASNGSQKNFRKEIMKNQHDSGNTGGDDLRDKNRDQDQRNNRNNNNNSRNASAQKGQPNREEVGNNIYVPQTQISGSSVSTLNLLKKQDVTTYSQIKQQESGDTIYVPKVQKQDKEVVILAPASVVKPVEINQKVEQSATSATANTTTIVKDSHPQTFQTTHISSEVQKENVHPTKNEVIVTHEKKEEAKIPEYVPKVDHKKADVKIPIDVSQIQKDIPEYKQHQNTESAHKKYEEVQKAKTEIHPSNVHSDPKVNAHVQNTTQNNTHVGNAQKDVKKSSSNIVMVTYFLNKDTGDKWNEIEIPVEANQNFNNLSSG